MEAAAIKLSDARWLSGIEDVQMGIVTFESAPWSSLAAVADSNSGSMLIGSVTVVAYVAVAFEIVKFVISVALNNVPLRARLEFVTPVIFSIMAAAGGDVRPS